MENFNFWTMLVLACLSALAVGFVLGLAAAWSWFPEKMARATEALTQEKTSLWTQNQSQELRVFLEPFKDKLREFETRMLELSAQERLERSGLRGEIHRLSELSLKMNQETQQLSRVLTRDVRVQGAWGELLLENILEQSGLRKGEEFLVQSSFLQSSTENQTESGWSSGTGTGNSSGSGTGGGASHGASSTGSRQRPDVILRLPENKCVIIDSKVSLTAFAEHQASSDKKTQESLAKSHVLSVKSHIDSLSDKKYYATDLFQSPEFVLLFIPLEAAFQVALQTRPDLLSYAWEKRIALVSPTTLLATLKTVSEIWKQDRQHKNALEIAKRAGSLYDKFAGFVGDLENVGDKLSAAQKSWSLALGKLHTGPGNLVSQAEKLRELGAKTEKTLSLPSVEI